jgi:membrane protein YdbS with pleckstrin-like domain
MDVINKPKVSRAISGAYLGFAIVVAAIGLSFIYLGYATPAGMSMSIAGLLVLVLVEPLFILILRSLFGTRYLLTDSELQIEATRLIGGGRRIPLGNIESVERTLIPFGIRLFGVSLHGGYYSVPSLGRAYLTITNFDDGLLLRGMKENYIITPRDPLGFKELLESKIASKKRQP